jgi:hypothetical protein
VIPNNFLDSKILSPLHGKPVFCDPSTALIDAFQMPWIRDGFAASLPDDVRKKLMARL